MTPSFTLFLVVSLAFGRWVPLAVAQDAPPTGGASAQLGEEIQALRKRIEELEKKVEELSGKLAEAAKKPKEEEAGEEAEEKLPGGGTFRPRGANLKALEKITLPVNATREQAVFYVGQIVEASKGQNSFSSEDPQTEMLIRVGSKHLDVLLQRWSDELEYYLVPAITQLATTDHKKLILDALRSRKKLVEVVVKKGWVKDARKVLVEELRGSREYLPEEWLEAVASLKDTAANKDLVAYLVNGGNKRAAYKALRSIQGIDLDKAVAEAWGARKRVVVGDFPAFFQDAELIPIAIGHGIREALDLAFERFTSKEGGSYGSYERKRMKEAILAHTAASGSDEEILAWYERNKKALRWDPTRKKFLGR